MLYDFLEKLLNEFLRGFKGFFKDTCYGNATEFYTIFGGVLEGIFEVFKGFFKKPLLWYFVRISYDFLMYFSRSPSVWICLKYVGDWNTKFCGQLPQTFCLFWRIPFRIVIIFLIISWGDSYRILIISWEDLIGKLAFFGTCEDNKTDFFNFFFREVLVSGSV